MLGSLSFSSEIAAALRDSKKRFVVTGANGWLGRATLEMLRASLGNAFLDRTVALGSRRAEVEYAPGGRQEIVPLADWEPEHSSTYFVFHYAFLTKDRVGNLAAADYVELNRAISRAARKWIMQGAVCGVVMPSSGAVYDHLNQTVRDVDAGIYGNLKLEDEDLFAAACKQVGAGLVVPRIFNLSGPFINKLQSYALASFISNVLESRPIEIRARRAVLRSYYFIGDLIELCVRGLLGKPDAVVKPFDVAGTEVVELNALAERVCRVMQRDSLAIVRPPLLLEELPDRYVGDRDMIERLEAELGLIPTGFDEQIRLTAEYLAHIQNQNS